MDRIPKAAPPVTTPEKKANDGRKPPPHAKRKRPKKTASQNRRRKSKGSHSSSSSLASSSTHVHHLQRPRDGKDRVIVVINERGEDNDEENQGWEVHEARSIPGRLFYYHPAARIATWTRPDHLPDDNDEEEEEDEEEIEEIAEEIPSLVQEKVGNSVTGRKTVTFSPLPNGGGRRNRSIPLEDEDYENGLEKGKAKQQGRPCRRVVAFVCSIVTTTTFVGTGLWGYCHYFASSSSSSITPLQNVTWDEVQNDCRELLSLHQHHQQQLGQQDEDKLNLGASQLVTGSAIMWRPMPNVGQRITCWVVLLWLPPKTRHDDEDRCEAATQSLSENSVVLRNTTQLWRYWVGSICHMMRGGRPCGADDDDVRKATTRSDGYSALKEQTSTVDQTQTSLRMPLLEQEGGDADLVASNEKESTPQGPVDKARKGRRQQPTPSRDKGTADKKIFLRGVQQTKDGLPEEEVWWQPRFFPLVARKKKKEKEKTSDNRQAQDETNALKETKTNTRLRMLQTENSLNDDTEETAESAKTATDNGTPSDMAVFPRDSASTGVWYLSELFSQSSFLLSGSARTPEAKPKDEDENRINTTIDRTSLGAKRRPLVCFIPFSRFIFRKRCRWLSTPLFDPDNVETFPTLE